MNVTSNLQAPIQHQRLQFLDVAKGILILLVVLGHSKFPFAQYIFWFHMPAFFFISGTLHKQPAASEIKLFIKKKSRALLLPYLAFGIVIATIVALYTLPAFGTGAVKNWVVQIGRLLLSGRALFGAFGAFWFIPCLFFTILSFTAIQYFVGNKKWAIAVLFVCYLVGIVLGNFKNLFLPWNLNVVPVAVFYYGIGFYSKELISGIYKMGAKKVVLFFAVFFVCCLSVFLSYKGYFGFGLDMKIAAYSNPAIAIIIPLLFTAAAILLSMLIEQTFASKMLAYLGANSLIIMYLHLPINYAIEAVTHVPPHYALFTLYGTAIPLLVGKLLDTTAFTKEVFLGKQVKPVKKVQVAA